MLIITELVNGDWKYTSQSRCRAQKERATRSEDAVEKLNSQLLEAETELAETRLAMDQLKSKHEKLGREKGQIEGDNTALTR